MQKTHFAKTSVNSSSYSFKLPNCYSKDHFNFYSWFFFKKKYRWKIFILITPGAMTCAKLLYTSDHVVWSVLQFELLNGLLLLFFPKICQRSKDYKIKMKIIAQESQEGPGSLTPIFDSIKDFLKQNHYFAKSFQNLSIPYNHNKAIFLKKILGLVIQGPFF